MVEEKKNSIIISILYEECSAITFQFQLIELRERKFISFKSNARVITEEMEFLLNENPIHRNRHRRL